MKTLTQKQAARLAKVVAQYPQFTFTVFDQNDHHETVTAWGIGVTDCGSHASKGFATKPKTKNGFKTQTAHTERGNEELTKALKAASAALWHYQPNFEA